MSKIRHYKVGDEPVPGYWLTAFLGSGGFGEVWKATAPGGTEVAIKINNLAMKGALKEFRSLKLVKRIQYPNLVPILAIWLKNEQGEILQEAAFEEVGAESKRGLTGTLTTNTIEYTPRSEPAELVIAMGLGHKSLADRLEECRKAGLKGIPVDELLSYLTDAARAIDYLNSPRHQFGSELKAIQHCDIKPPNILIVGDAAQVCDFGLARETDNLRNTSLAISPVYAAPEMIESNTPSPTTDQYSLAMSYLELRTGELPFPPDSTAHTVIQAHLAGKIDLSRLEPAEREVIRRATARQPADRYPSASDMIAALREACHPSSVVTRRRTWLWWTAACVALGLMTVPVAVQLFGILPVGPRPLILPAGFVADPAAKRVPLHDRACPERVICEMHGLHVPFRLIDSRRSRAFYIMETKVSNEVFARFADGNPAAVADSKWKLGACADQKNLGVEGRSNYPVFRITCIEAGLCASWLGGELPSTGQWDEAAGRFAASESPSGIANRGPFRPLDPGLPVSEQVAIDRGIDGPLPNGAATHDESSPFGCRDMAGNGLEWTRTSTYGADEFSPDKPDELMRVFMRGRTYLNPEPLRYSDLDNRSSDDIRRVTEANCDIGFRIVITFKDLP